MLDSLLHPIKLPTYDSLKEHEGKGNYAISKYYKLPYRPFYRKKLYMVRDLLDKGRVYKNILDFGSGPGVFTKELKRHSLSTHSVDKGHYIDGRSKFELIICASSLEFIEDLPRTMLMLSKLCTPRGQLIVASPLSNIITQSYFSMIGDDLVRNSKDTILYSIERFFKVTEYHEWMGLYFSLKATKI